MTLKLDGSTGSLVHEGKIVDAFPFTIVEWVSKDGSSGGTGHAWLSQGQSNADRYVGIWLDTNGTSKYATHRNPGASANANDATAPNPDTTMRLAIGVYTSANSRTSYFGDNVGVENTTARTDDIASHDRVMIGARRYNSEASPSIFANANVGEAHFYNVALDSAARAALFAAAKPEEIAGWVDGWILKDFEASGNYVSIGGTRTLVASGGVTAGTATHPIDRSGASLNLTVTNTTLGMTSGTGAVTSEPPEPGTVNLIGSDTTLGLTSSTGVVDIDPAMGTITSDPFTNYSNTLQAGVTIPVTVLMEMDGGTALIALNEVTDGAGQIVFTDAALAIGTDYMMANFNADGSATGLKKYTAA